MAKVEILNQKQSGKRKEKHGKISIIIISIGTAKLVVKKRGGKVRRRREGEVEISLWPRLALPTAC